MWIIFFIPTMLCSIDFLWVSLNAPNLLVDHAHYVALTIWVVANSVWAISNIWYPDYDRPLNMFEVNDEALKTGRWFSSWVVMFSWTPIVLLHTIWIYGTATGKIIEEEENATEMKVQATQSPFSHAEEGGAAKSNKSVAAY